jgi:ABC-type polysaccharide/polyol phosphate transport system ATPase subunit
LIRAVCNKAILLQSGRIVAVGAVDEMFERYDAIVHAPPAASAPAS